MNGIHVIREEKIFYKIKTTKKLQLERVIVFSCVTCSRECRTNSKKMKASSFTGKCKICVNRRKPFESLYVHFLWAAKSRGLDNSITFAQFLFFTGKTICFYCDSPIPWKPYGKERTSRGYFLDRKNSDLGYSIKNCVVCCHSCNLTKAKRYSYEEFVLLSPGLIKIMKKRRSK